MSLTMLSDFAITDSKKRQGRQRKGQCRLPSMDFFSPTLPWSLVLSPGTLKSYDDGFLVVLLRVLFSGRRPRRSNGTFATPHAQQWFKPTRSRSVRFRLK